MNNNLMPFRAISCHFMPLYATLPTAKKIFLLLTTRRKFQYRPYLRMLRGALIEGLEGV